MVKDNEYWKNNYVSVQLWKQDAVIKGLEEGFSRGREEGIAQQKAEDEKLILAERKRVSKQADEIARLIAENEKLKQQLSNSI